jgi:hypothetical protein
LVPLPISIFTLFSTSPVFVPDSNHHHGQTGGRARAWCLRLIRVHAEASLSHTLSASVACRHTSTRANNALTLPHRYCPRPHESRSRPRQPAEELEVTEIGSTTETLSDGALAGACDGAFARRAPRRGGPPSDAGGARGRAVDTITTRVERAQV